MKQQGSRGGRPFRKFGGAPRGGGFRGRGGDREAGKFGGKSFGGESKTFGGRGLGGRGRFLARAREDLREAFTGRGAPVVQAVRAIDDLDSASSLIQQRLKELFALNFPEFSIDNDESYARVLREFGRREDLEKGQLEKLVGEKKAGEILERAGKSFGAEFDEAEKRAVQSLAAALAELQKSRKELEKFVEGGCGKFLKNVSYLVEPIVAARLLSAAGSLEKLAQMPSSTIQVIGAEKSLFKHLRSGTPPPKHGLIFNSQMIRTAPKDRRGRIARVLAGKLAIAAKADAYTGNFIAPKLKQDLEKALKR